MKKIYLLFVALVFIGMSCEKDDISDCLQQKIDEFANGDYACETGASVKQYVFQNETVYVFDPGLCGADFFSEVIDENCNTLGQLGGIEGNTEINGGNFSEATYIKTIWDNSLLW
jgi:hypothetical protein